VARSDGKVAVARWFGDETAYYPASRYAPGGPRVFFALPKETSQFFDYATDQGRLMLKNAILSLLPIYHPTGDLDRDRDLDFGDFAVFAGYWPDSNCLDGTLCSQADFTGDANIAADDLAVLAAGWLAGADLTPPEPNVMTWQAEPMAVSTTSVYMAATTATDTQNGVQYFFRCVSENGPDSGWQYPSVFEPNTLTPGTEYVYRAAARDTSSHLNQTQWSDAATVRTFEKYYEIADASAGVAIDRCG